MGSSQDSSKTEVTLATWSFWPNAPTPAQDFGRLIPESRRARDAFRAVIASSDSGNQHKREFMHWELAVEDSEQGPASSFTSNGSSKSPRTAAGATHASVVTGFYRFQRSDPGVEPAHWLAGKGRKDRRVHFILTTARSDGLHGIHTTFTRASSGLVQVIANHDVEIDGHLLRKGDTRIVFNTVSIGHLVYRIEYLSEQATPSGTSRSLSSYGTLMVADYFATPTVSTVQNLEVGDYRLGIPVGSGASSVVYYGVHKLTGQYVAVKRITTASRPSLDELARHEIRMLQLLSHVSTTSVEDQADLSKSPTSQTSADSYKNWTVVDRMYERST
ncbi:putative CAMK/CAMKL/BRSK protein kinase [Teratosphaeria destructans]|uniref:CAMK/CAMKL/BRSK protein kinase n=1 Tax=Teratosphaeria destructans TaxID=418781 RepID=A0A9W7W4Y6_9PEZI|nr:putative CAMK/CAMKL/BRSK protein kinase [Teratosphaeria destructans]